MKHYVITFTFLIFFSITQFSVASQSVKYYKLNKIEDYGNVNNSCVGGQFVKISRNICFDTDAQGNYVGNGKLYRDLGNSSTNHIYKGQSFHGNAKYIFSNDYRSLIVEITPKFRYFYSLDTPPSGVTTCSLIRTGGDNSYDSGINSIPSQNGTNNGYYNGGLNQNSGSDSNSNSNSSSNVNTPAHKFKCAYCNGTGQIEKNNNAPANFGTDRPRQRCNECGKWYDPDVFTHYHQQCRHCGGTGYAK